jgi:PAS domain S-box-containing protein
MDDTSTHEFPINRNNIAMQKKITGSTNQLEAIFQSFMKETPNMAWVIDENENLVFASKAFNEFFKIEKGSLNNPVADLLPERIVAFLYKKHKEVFATGKAVQTIQKIPMADGTTFVFLVNIFPIEGAASKKMIGGHAINVAEKYAIEKKLKIAQERFLLLSHTTTDAIWEWDMQTGQMFRNAALMEMVGYSEIQNSNGLAWWLRRIHPEDRRKLEEKLKEATDSGLKSWEDDYRFKCADGIYKYIHDRGYIVYENGLPVRMIGSLNDVTQIKQLQHQLEEEKLERQKQVSEIILKVQEQERTKIDRELHDNVNQILSTCMLFVDMLKPGNREQKKYKDKSLEYLQSAIEEIRTLSKELVLPDLKQMGLVEGVQKLIGDIQMSGKVRIEFVHHIANVRLSTGRKITLFRIIQEQLKNILSHSRAKQVEISLAETDGMLYLTIKDNGIGFDPRQTRRGIGVSNIYERTRFYNGTATITTAPGEGCALTVMIPVLN